MAYRVLALALLLVAFSSGEIHDATENLPNAGDSVELPSESTAAPEAHASPDGKGAEKVNEKGAATEEEAPGTTINEVNKEAAAATEEEAAATTTTNQVNEKAAATTNNEVNEKAAATEEEAAATTTNKAPVVDHSRDGNVGEVTEIKTMVKMKTTYDPNSTPCPSGFTMQSKTDLGFTTGGHTTQAHGWLCKCTAGCGCVDGDNKPAILTAHVDGSSNTNGISTSNYNTLVDTLQSKVNSFVTSQREAGINSATTALNSCSEERARLGEGVQDRLGSGELKLTTFQPKLFGDYPNRQWIIDFYELPNVLKVDGHYDWKWRHHPTQGVSSSGISELMEEDINPYLCPMLGGGNACFQISVVNPDPFYGTSGMVFKRDDLEAVVNECLQANTIGGYKVLQALKLVGTSGNDDFLGTRQGYNDITNGLPGTKSTDAGSSKAKGMVITYFLKVDGTPDGYTDFYGRPEYTTCNNANAKWKIEGSETTSAYVCQVKAVITLWRRSGGNTCSESTTPMVKVHAEVDHTQDNWVTMVSMMNAGQGGEGSYSGNDSHRRRRRGPGTYEETFMDLAGAYEGSSSSPSCLPSAGSCRAAARKVDLHVRQKLNAARFDMVKDCSSDRRRVSLPSYRTTHDGNLVTMAPTPPPTPRPSDLRRRRSMYLDDDD